MSLTEFFVTSTFSSKLYRVIFEFQPVIDLYKLFTYGRWYMFFCFHVFYSFINLYFQIICIVSHQISNQYFCSIVFGYWMEFSFIIEKFNSATKFMLYICLCISKKIVTDNPNFSVMIQQQCKYGHPGYIRKQQTGSGIFQNLQR